MLKRIFQRESLESCPCGKKPWIEKRETAPGANWLEAGPVATIVRCHCGLTLFNGNYADSFADDKEAGEAWNALMRK